MNKNTRYKYNYKYLSCTVYLRRVRYISRERLRDSTPPTTDYIFLKLRLRRVTKQEMFSVVQHIISTILLL